MGSKLNITHLLNAASAYDKDLPREITQTTQPDPKGEQDKTNLDRPFTELEKYQKYVQWMIGSKVFITDPNLEQSTKYTGKRPNGCAKCANNYHT